MTVNAGAWTGQVHSRLGTCLDVLYANPANHADSYPCNTTVAQQWTMPGDGSVRALGKCLDVRLAGTDNSTPVQLYDCNGTVAQKWETRADQSLYNPHSGRCLDIRLASAAPLDSRPVYDCNRTVVPALGRRRLAEHARAGHQHPQQAVPRRPPRRDRGRHAGPAVPVQRRASPRRSRSRPNGSLQVEGKCVDVQYAGRAPGTPVWLWACNGTVAQEWQVTADGQLRNPWSGLCLDTPNNAATVSLQLQVWSCNTTDAQKWRLPA